MTSPLQERRFAHEPVICKQKGKLKLYCRCGTQAPPMDSLTEALHAYSLHVGLKEMERKQVLR